MTTISPQQGANYFTLENYYSSQANQKNSQWYGLGAALLGLFGEVEAEPFKSLLYGVSPSGKKLSGKPIDPDKHRAGFDLTFSAPKSVSLAALMGGDKNLEAAHRAAVERTLDIIQERYAQTRTRTADGRKVVKTGNLIVAQFHHDTSREKDPQLHTHCVVINATQLDNGKWQSVHNDAFYNNKMLLGAIYRNELAQEIKKLGYEVELRQEEKDGFELKGYTREQLDHFSKRRQQIVEMVGEKASAIQKAWANLKSRAPKGQEIPRDELLGWWLAQNEALQLNIQHPIPNPEAMPPNSASSNQNAIVQVKEAIAHASERNVAFKTEALEKFVLSQIKDFSFTELQQAIQDSPELISTFDNRYTTNSALNRELETIRLMQHGRGQFGAIAHPEIVDSLLENKVLTSGQRQAVTLAATSTDQFIAWQGVAGAGKTYALNEFKAIAIAQGYILKGFAPSAEAAKVLSDETGIESTTVASLLLIRQQQLTQQQSRQVWIIDEAGLLSAKDAIALLKQASQHKVRVILVGDTRQLSAVEAGNPFKSLQQAGISTAYLNQSLRQRTRDLQLAVDLIAHTQVESGFNILDRNQRLTEIADPGERLRQLVSDYMSLDPEERKKTLILAGTNANRHEITRAIREELKVEGRLGQEKAIATILRARNLTQIQKNYTHYYHLGDIVVPTRQYSKKGLERDLPYTVTAVEGDSITLLAASGRELTINPKSFCKNLYSQQPIEIAVGESLKWTQNNKTLHRRNGQEFTVIGIEGKEAQIQYNNGRCENIDLTQPQHLDYALVSTVYSSQGKTAERVLIAADSTLGKEDFYVATSRVKQDLKLYTENKADLLCRIQKSKAKENPRELITAASGLELQAPAFERLQPRVFLTPVSHDSQNRDGGDEEDGRDEEDRGVEGENIFQSSQPSQPSSPSPSSLFVKRPTTYNHTRHEQPQPRQSQPTDGESMGRGISERLNAHSAATRPHREPDRAVSSRLRANVGYAQNVSTRTRETRTRTRESYDRIRTARETLTALADSVRNTPLEEIAPQLGLTPDKHDLHKWRGSGQIISITDNKFYDWMALKGGAGAIDLVMHCQDAKFKEALAWLSNQSVYSLENPAPPQSPQVRDEQQSPRKPFIPPVQEEDKWHDVRAYLVEQRGLKASHVDSLHELGVIYADERRNAVFLRQQLNEDFTLGKATGASIRGSVGNFKGLATGTKREDGWFSFALGKGEAVNRVVLTEAPIDALSFAALDKERGVGRTVYLATDGAGAIPQKQLQQLLEKGGQVIIAFDADEAGEKMAQQVNRILKEVGARRRDKGEVENVTRSCPEDGYKDWNEQLLQSRQLGTEINLDTLRWWYRSAQLLDKSSQYIDRITEVVMEFKQGSPLSPEAVEAMKGDISKVLDKWLKAAITVHRSSDYQAYIQALIEQFDSGQNLPTKPLHFLTQDIQVAQKHHPGIKQ
jgi:conjugative relaxase-like TrwC/TraI family protein